MIPHGFWWLLVDSLAAYRLTRIVVLDKIGEPFRHAAFRRAGYLEGELIVKRSAVWWFVSELVECMWCFGVWVSAVVVALTALIPDVWRWPALTFAVAAVCGLAERT